MDAMSTFFYQKEGKYMEVTISADTIIKLAALLTALGVIGGAALWCFKFVARNKKQDEAIAAIRNEQTLICYGVLACLKGLKEKGCNGPVTAALDKLEKHLNEAAHGEE